MEAHAPHLIIPADVIRVLIQLTLVSENLPARAAQFAAAAASEYIQRLEISAII